MGYFLIKGKMARNVRRFIFGVSPDVSAINVFVLTTNFEEEIPTRIYLTVMLFIAKLQRQ